MHASIVIARCTHKYASKPIQQYSLYLETLKSTRMKNQNLFHMLIRKRGCHGQMNKGYFIKNWHINLVLLFISLVTWQLNHPWVRIFIVNDHSKVVCFEIPRGIRQNTFLDLQLPLFQLLYETIILKRLTTSDTIQNRCSIKLGENSFCKFIDRAHFFEPPYCDPIFKIPFTFPLNWFMSMKKRKKKCFTKLYSIDKAIWNI